MADRGGEFSFFQGIIHVLKTDISIFYQTYAHQIWQAGLHELTQISLKSDSHLPRKLS